MTLDPRSSVETIFQAALQAVAGDQAVMDAVVEDEFGSRVHLVAIGKAASAMALGAKRVLDGQITQALILTKYEHTAPELLADSRFRIHESSHPIPDAASLQAGAHLIDFVSVVDEKDDLLVLLSGGASALVEQLPPNMSLDDLSRVTDFMLSSGMDITQMNRIRRSLSCIKGGGLGASLSGCRVRQYVISDVPGDKLQDIGSGPLALVDTQVDRASDASSDLPDLPELPDWLTGFIDSAPQIDADCRANLSRVESRIVASSSKALQTAINKAEELGLVVAKARGDLHQNVTDNARMIASQLLDADAIDGVYIWAGESTVNLPDNPGRGGRNQHLAALLAAQIEDQPVTILCGATDGTDGPTADAGGVVDGQSCARAHQLGLDIEHSIADSDTGNWLEACGSLLTTGPTGTNVMDLVIALRSPLPD